MEIFHRKLWAAHIFLLIATFCSSCKSGTNLLTEQTINNVSQVCVRVTSWTKCSQMHSLMALHNVWTLYGPITICRRLWNTLLSPYDSSNTEARLWTRMSWGYRLHRCILKLTSQERKKNIWVPNVDSSELVCIYPDKKKIVFPQKRSMKPILLITFVQIGLNMHLEVCAVALLD